MAEKANFNKRIEDITNRAQIMRSLIIDSQFNPITNMYIDDESERLNAIDARAAEMPMFESLSDVHRRGIVSGMASSIVEYEQTHGHLPSDELLASAHKSMENLLQLDEDKSHNSSESKPMYESIGKSLSTSEGVEIRAKMVGLVLPVLLYTSTADAVTYIPAANDEIEIFKVYRTAGSTFGEFVKGQVIDDSTIGQYAQMRQRYKLADAQLPDGTKKQYIFTSSADLPAKIEVPMKKGSVAIYYNRRKVATDFDTKGKLFGDVVVGDVTVNINGTTDYGKGIITVTSSAALATGEMHAEFEIDIESKPELIPVIDHEMDSRKMRPSQSAIAADATIQAIFSMKREFNIDIQSMQMTHLRNYLANEKSLKHLRDMIFAAIRKTTFNIYTPPGEDWKLHREKFRETLLGVSQEINSATQTTGLRGLFCGVQASKIIQSYPRDSFVYAPNYQQVPRVHFVGTLFGIYNIYEVPVPIDDLGPWDCLGYGRGSSHSEAGYVAGDAIPATMYTHPIGANLRTRETLWELAYGEVHPYSGEDYFYRITIEDVKPIVKAEEAA